MQRNGNVFETHCRALLRQNYITLNKTFAYYAIIDEYWIYGNKPTKYQSRIFLKNHCQYCFVSSYKWDSFDELRLSQLSVLSLGYFDQEESCTVNSIMDALVNNILEVIFTWDRGQSLK